MFRLLVLTSCVVVWSGCRGAAPADRLAAIRDSYAAGTLPAETRSQPRETGKPKFGPPPPGYVRITGEPVPGWDPASMRLRSVGPLNWSPLGPRPIEDEFWSGSDDASGRVVSIACDPANAAIAYAASASGGLWKTTSSGATWTPLTDELATLNHGCVTIDPTDSNVIYLGTGEYTTFSTGDGLFRSEDAGATWQRIATSGEVGSTCSSVLVDPLNPNRLHVAGEFGYIRSPNRGDTWSRKLTASVSSLSLDPGDPDTIFAGVHGDGVYRSTDAGLNWSRLSSGLPGSDVSRVLVAVAPSDPDTVYAALINNSAGLRGLYVSTNGGDTWSQKSNTPDFPTPQGWYDAFLGVDPSDEDTVYCGGVFPSYAVAGVIRTTNGGNSWTDITIPPLGGQLHPDQHTIAFGSDGALWVGNDGGVWRSTNGGQGWINCNNGLAVTQNYNLALHPSDPDQVMTGTQDNGTVGRFADQDGWPQILAGDGGFLAYDASDPTRVYTTYVYLSIYRIDSDFANISGPWDGDPRNFIAPLVMDPTDSDILLGGTNRIWRTTNASGAADWSPISGTNIAGGGTLNAIAIAPSDTSTIYSGSTTGAVWVTTNNGGNWNDRSAGLPGGQISDIVIDPNDPDRAYVSFYNSSGRRLLRTVDAGLNWDRIPGLPSGVAARALAVDWTYQPPVLYVGSGSGIYVSADDGASWEKDGSEFPNVNVGDLAIDPGQRTITAATYGRGAWRADLAVPETTPGDINGDGSVDLSDLAELLAVYGTCSGDAGYNPAADFDNNGCVDLSDLAILLNNFGT